jgi:hypothetical protein
VKTSNLTGEMLTGVDRNKAKKREERDQIQRKSRKLKRRITS